MQASAPLPKAPQPALRPAIATAPSAPVVTESPVRGAPEEFPGAADSRDLDAKNANVLTAELTGQVASVKQSQVAVVQVSEDEEQNSVAAVQWASNPMPVAPMPCTVDELSACRQAAELLSRKNSELEHRIGHLEEKMLVANRAAVRENSLTQQKLSTLESELLSSRERLNRLHATVAAQNEKDMARLAEIAELIELLAGSKAADMAGAEGGSLVQ